MSAAVHSMTGFARTEVAGDYGRLVWELRSVNHRFLELSIKLPEELRAAEAEVRELLSQRVARGKLDASLRLHAANAGASTGHVDFALVDRLAGLLQSVQPRFPAAAPVSVLDILRWPGVMAEPARDWQPATQAALALLERALAELNATRAREGARLAAVIEDRLDAMSALVQQARARLPEVMVRWRERLLERLGELKASLDPQRLEQELVLVAQRLDVDEELERLGAHFVEARRVLAAGGALGRRLDFLTQEFHREANTLGSKSQDTELTRISVELKVYIEQIREQVQNLA